MKTGLFSLIALALLAGGCSKSEETTPPQTVLNPGGKVENLPPEAQASAAQQQKAGENSAQNMDEAARQFNAARAAAGGK